MTTDSASSQYGYHNPANPLLYDISSLQLPFLDECSCLEQSWLFRIKKNSQGKREDEGKQLMKLQGMEDANGLELVQEWHEYVEMQQQDKNYRSQTMGSDKETACFSIQGHDQEATHGSKFIVLHFIRDVHADFYFSHPRGIPL
jgi:hypothetical protein